jgi:hypothetical protein
VDVTVPTFPNMSSHATELGIGLRHNFNARERLRPFTQVEVIRSTYSDSNSFDTCRSSPNFDYVAAGGGEYFLASRVSLEGSAGVAYSHGSQRCTFGDPSVTYRQSEHAFGTFRTLLSINFYF